MYKRQAEAVAAFAKAFVAPVVSIGASSSSGSGGPPPAVAAGASGSGRPSPAANVYPASVKSISNELRRAAFGKSHVKGDWGKLWKAVKDRRKHQETWDLNAEKRLTFSAAGMVRFAKCKKVAPWVAASPHDLPTDYVPTENDKRLEIIDTLLAEHSPDTEAFDDLKQTCMLIYGFEGSISDLMSTFAKERPEDVTIGPAEAANLPAPVAAAQTARALTVSQRRRAVAGIFFNFIETARGESCLLYTSPSPRD